MTDFLIGSVKLSASREQPFPPWDAHFPAANVSVRGKLCAGRRENDADAVVVRHEQGLEPLLAVYSLRVIERLEDYIFSGQSRAQDFLATINCSYFDLQSPGNGLPVYFNVNTPTDYARVIE